MEMGEKSKGWRAGQMDWTIPQTTSSPEIRSLLKIKLPNEPISVFRLYTANQVLMSMHAVAVSENEPIFLQRNLRFGEMNSDRREWISCMGAGERCLYQCTDDPQIESRRFLCVWMFDNRRGGIGGHLHQRRQGRSGNQSADVRDFFGGDQSRRRWWIVRRACAQSGL